MTGTKSRIFPRLAGALALWLASILLAVAVAAAALAARTSDEAGVRVVVTPQIADAGATVWEFEVVMDTHTKPLSDDLARTAVLTDDAGRLYAPLAWQGDPPGGHHRKGVLRFAAPEGKPKAIELRLKDMGGVDERVFRWELE